MWSVYIRMWAFTWRFRNVGVKIKVILKIILKVTIKIEILLKWWTNATWCWCVVIIYAYAWAWAWWSIQSSSYFNFLLQYISVQFFHFIRYFYFYSSWHVNGYFFNEFIKSVNYIHLIINIIKLKYLNKPLLSTSVLTKLGDEKRINSWKNGRYFLVGKIQKIMLLLPKERLLISLLHVALWLNE